MDNLADYEAFKQKAKEAASFLKDITKPIRVVSHIDSDGICSAALLVNMLNKQNIRYSLSTVQQLNQENLTELKNENYGHYIFTDLGSGQIDSVGEILQGKKILVLDHHELGSEKEYDNIVHVNPHQFGIDGGKEISGSGVVYFFTLGVCEEEAKKFAHVAVIGAVGDIQEQEGFHQLNDEILQTAIAEGNIEVTKGFRFFGLQTRPIHKILEYSSDPYIPDVSGSESGAIQFLQQLGIEPRKGSDWKKVSDLSEEEMKKLAAGIIMKRHSEENPEDIFGNIYSLPNEEEGTLRDIKEFSTLLNACGRMNKASMGIGACIGDDKIKKRALDVLVQYRKQLIKAIKWFRENENSEKVIKKNGYLIINAETNVPVTMIGTLASIVSRSNEFDHRTYVLAMAQNDDNTSKISLRISGFGKNEDIDLRKVAGDIVEKVGGEAGGHLLAAGAIIETEKEAETISTALEIFGKLSMEESIN